MRAEYLLPIYTLPGGRLIIGWKLGGCAREEIRGAKYYKAMLEEEFLDEIKHLHPEDPTQGGGKHVEYIPNEQLH